MIIKVYPITKEQFTKTKYRPLGVEVCEIETEEGWNYKDVVENAGENCEEVANCSDLMVWKVMDSITGEEKYVVELTA